MPLRPVLVQMAAGLALVPGCVPQNQSKGEVTQKPTKIEFSCSLPQDFRLIRTDEHSKRVFLEGTKADVTSQRKVDPFLKRLDKAIGHC